MILYEIAPLLFPFHKLEHLVCWNVLYTNAVWLPVVRYHAIFHVNYALRSGVRRGKTECCSPLNFVE
jgi:hypothetical protein